MIAYGLLSFSLQKRPKPLLLLFLRSNVSPIDKSACLYEDDGGRCV